MDGGGYIPHLAPPLAHLVARLLLQRLACALQVLHHQVLARQLRVQII